MPSPWEPVLRDFEEVLEFFMPDLLVACLDFTVEVREGAILAVEDGGLVMEVLGG